MNIDFIIVLGSSLNNDNSPTPELIRRLEMALIVSKEHIDSKIILSGGVCKNCITEAEFMKNFLIQNGIEESRIIIETLSRDTVDNVKNCIEIINNESEVALITGADHMKRAGTLLEEYLKKKFMNVMVYRFPSGNLSNNNEVSLKEDFLLFKDLGRFLEFLYYQNYIPLS